jgi:hypothetical protein
MRLAGPAGDSLLLTCLDEPALPGEPTVVSGEEVGPLYPDCYEHLLEIGYVFEP